MCSLQLKPSLFGNHSLQLPHLFTAMASFMPPHCWQGMNQRKPKDKVRNQPSQVNNMEPLPHGANAKCSSAGCAETPRSDPPAAIKLLFTHYFQKWFIH